MCTVSFLPLLDGGYLLGTNRDESPHRGRALPPAVYDQPGRKVLMPRDADAGGTWVTVDDRGRSLCILNGDRPVAPASDEAPSRGTLLVELAGCATPATMLHQLQQRHAAGRLNHRAFKLLVVEPGSGGQPANPQRIEWNGRELIAAPSPGGAFLLVSNSFDPEGVALARGQAFSSLAAVTADDPQGLASAQTRWHATHSPDAPGGDTYTVCMHRAEAATVSFTAVRVDAVSVQMQYIAGPPCEGRPPALLELERSS